MDEKKKALMRVAALLERVDRALRGASQELTEALAEAERGLGLKPLDRGVVTGGGA